MVFDWGKDNEFLFLINYQGLLKEELIHELCPMQLLFKLSMILFLLVSARTHSPAQCINVFPYSENFEAASSPWTTGGINSDWALGSPSKSIINAAGSGVQCWITGGLTNSPYNGGQKSWLQSPCFDFSGLNYPYLSFLIFWDTERQYDGGNLQYSLNSGNSWFNVGSSGGGSDCRTKNWFNAGNINNLAGLASPQQGWSGTTSSGSGSCLGGNGSGEWKQAGYCLSNLAGEANVVFRFTFSSGTTCNDYDGMAVDSFSISELVFPAFDFNYTCETDRRVLFTGTGGDCPSQYQWDFGDPSSSTNSSTLLSDTHTFSSPGSYSVVFTINEPCIGNLGIRRTVIIPELNATSYPVSCPGIADGAISVDAGGLQNPVFIWNVSPANTTDSIYGLEAGNYQVTVSGDSACTQTLNIALDFDPDAIPKPALPDKLLICPGEELVLDPGVFTSYLWSTGSVDPVITVNDIGWYSVTVTNVKGCIGADSVLLLQNCFTGVYVPSAFSPNADGKNDVFKAYSGTVEDFQLIIYNRFGAKVFISSTQNDGWDGRYNNAECQEGVYTWQIDYRNPQNKPQIIRGRVLLMR